MLKLGETVTYRDRSNQLRSGTIDKTSSKSGQKLYRVDDHWFTKDALTVVQ